MTYSDVDILAALQRGASELNALDEESACGIENWIRVGPIDKAQLQPASIDLKLGNEFWRFLPSEYVDMVDRVVGMAREEWPDGSFVELKPKELMLATTVERIELGAHGACCARDCGVCRSRLQGSDHVGAVQSVGEYDSTASGHGGVSGCVHGVHDASDATLRFARAR